MFDVPLAPRHCSSVVIWQNTVVTVWDVREWISPGSAAADTILLAVVGHQAAKRQTPRFGAVLLAEPLRRVAVTDEQACEPPGDTPAWGRISNSCFCHEGRPTSILDLALMFSGSKA